WLFLNHLAPPGVSALSLHDALPISLARELARNLWRCALPHFRGCSGEPNRLPRAYHSGDAEEIGWILRRFSSEASGAPLFAVGRSEEHTSELQSVKISYAVFCLQQK